MNSECETSSCVQNDSGVYTTDSIASWQAPVAILSELNNIQGDILKSFPVLTNVVIITGNRDGSP